VIDRKAGSSFEEKKKTQKKKANTIEEAKLFFGEQQR